MLSLGSFRVPDVEAPRVGRLAAHAAVQGSLVTDIFLTNGANAFTHHH